MENKNRNFSPLLIRLGLIVLMVVATLITWSILKQIAKKKEIQKEISKLEEEADRISRENILAQERISYFESPEYKEREAKEKLNLKSPEEEVIIVKPGIIKKEEPLESAQKIISNNLKVENNFIKWLNYFFRR